MRRRTEVSRVDGVSSGMERAGGWISPSSFRKLETSSSEIWGIPGSTSEAPTSNRASAKRSRRSRAGEESTGSILAQSAEMKARRRCSGARRRWIWTLPSGVWLERTVGVGQLLSAKPARSGDGCFELLLSMERLENLPKYRKCFGMPLPSPRGVACLEVVRPLEMFLAKESL